MYARRNDVQAKILLLYCRTKRLTARQDSGTPTTWRGILLVPTASNRQRAPTRRCPATDCRRAALPKRRCLPFIISSRHRRRRRRLATRSNYCELSCVTSPDEYDILKSFFSTGSPTSAMFERYDLISTDRQFCCFTHRVSCGLRKR